VQWTEIQWLNGLPAGIQGMNLTLQRIPRESDLVEPETDEFQFDTGSLTDRQISDANGAANRWLQGNIERLPPSDRPAVESGNFELGVSQSGNINLSVNNHTTPLGQYRTRQLNDPDLSFVGGTFIPARGFR
jgi:hypothetical protein